MLIVKAMNEQSPKKEVSKFELELMKINAMDLTPENKQLRMKQAWAKHGRKVVYIKKMGPFQNTPASKEPKTKGEVLAKRFLEATGKRWEDATPEERKHFLFPEVTEELVDLQVKGGYASGKTEQLAELCERDLVSGDADALRPTLALPDSPLRK